jgi:hypothetical protein
MGRGIAYFQQQKGDEFSFYSGFDFKPIDRLVIEPNFNFVLSRDTDSDDELFKQFVARTRVRLQLNRELSLRLVVQYNSVNYGLYDNEGNLNTYKSRKWDIDPLVTYRVSSFTVFYIGSTSDYRHLDRMADGKPRWRLTDRQFFMKIQYLFQT